ncbi:GTPase [Methanolobus profundi]|uniref:Ras superfamily GTP-binding protein YlqF n=1 Tax=Methanolobus profundi TaxID=487685 RepID=A0A1I4NF91_9EURY|nr:GTPase [Methanolobus profundi]SFM14168.1 Ras superfamily GTP-binding protein YlqF [Methanolobus profundi]
MASQKMIVKDVIKKADILLEVVDARFPDDTRNSEIERELKRIKKPFIIVLNKCDLVSKEKLEKAKSRMAKTAPAVFVSSKQRFGTTMLRHKILEVADIQGRNITVGCIGYPNTGKSSVINGVAGRGKASTSAISGHTKGVQIVNAGSRIVFLDTPGVFPLDEHDEYIQGLLGVKDSTHLKDPIGVAMKIIERMVEDNKEILESFYKVKITDENSYDILEMIGTQCNFLKKKGAIDETRAAIRIINDWQKGALLEEEL